MTALLAVRVMWKPRRVPVLRRKTGLLHIWLLRRRLIARLLTTVCT
jgi:hypothetical protein